MKLFGWLKNDPESKGLVPGRAVAIPHYPRIEMRSNAVENNSGPNSVSTLSVTLRLLQPGETAEAIGSQYERLPINKAHTTTNTPEGCQRLHINCPNWVHLLVRQEGNVCKEHTEVPVWVSPVTGKIDRINKDKLIEELEPEKGKALEIWEEGGMFGRMNQAGSTTSGASESSLDLGGMLGELFGGGVTATDGATTVVTSSSDTSEDPLKPDMSKHPPIQGVDFDLWVAVAAGIAKQRIPPANHDPFAQSQGVPAGCWAEIERAWNQRVMTDWKLGAMYGEAYEQAMKKK